MQIKTPSTMPSVVKREDKYDNIRTFIAAALLVPRGPGAASEISLVARSAQSPVARALASLGNELASRGLTVRAIFANLESEKTPEGWTVSGPAIPFQRDLRWAKNPRLADAHEQLVIGESEAWVGDCLRRDPDRRDAYEQFVAADPTTSRTLTLSFSRLWGACQPLEIRTLRPSIAQAALAAQAEQPGPLSSIAN